jgi:ParB family chromosome partitioning protein
MRTAVPFPALTIHLERSNEMTATTDTTADETHREDVPPPEASGDHGTPAQPPAGRAMIAVELLTAHPGNVRHDVSLDPEFLASITELGILTSLRITPDGSGGYRVIEGHRRLAAAEKLGIAEVPCDLATEREGDEAGQFLDMYAANHHRKGLTALEEADALFAASATGATRTRIRKATGLDREQVGAALGAAKMSGVARETAQAFGYAITLDQLALLAEFDGDEQAVSRLTTAICDGRSGEHAAEGIRQERAELAEHERLAAQLRGDGYAITTQAPPGTSMLHALAHDGQELTPETHAACPGRGVYFHAWNPLTPHHYCTDPEGNGHASRYQPAPLPDLSGENPETGSGAGTRTESGPAGDPGRKLVVEGNRAWTAACTVRRRWLAEVLLPRRTAPKQAMAFITAQALAMPAPLRDALAGAPGSVLFYELTRGNFRAAEVEAWPAARLPLVLLAAVAAAYEDRMGGDPGKATWRAGRYSPCSREEAGAWFRFLGGIGYELSLIEQAVADGVPLSASRPATTSPRGTHRTAARTTRTLAMTILQAKPLKIRLTRGRVRQLSPRNPR